jgi:hypothetical protein
MNFYELDERGELVRLASLATDDPEPDTAQIVPGSTGASPAA